MDFVTPDPCQDAIEQWVRDARTDPAAEAQLRYVVSRCGTSAPMEDLVRIGQTLVEIRRDYVKAWLEQR